MKAERPGDASAEIAGYEIAMLTYAAAYVVAAACWLFIDPDKPIENPIPTPEPTHDPRGH
jgi:hypothetical protein